jgi:hypothetical protein
MMSKRLQVIIEEAEYRAIRKHAKRRGLTVAAWVRSALRTARDQQPAGDADRKLAAVRAATECSFPTADIDDMLAEIERGYAGLAT